jgi:hypothetical protein
MATDGLPTSSSTPAAVSGTEAKAKVFISYSRSDMIASRSSDAPQ